MSRKKASQIQLRGFISLLTALSFLIMTISGIILFVVPQGRIASWIDWRMFGLTKTQWGDIHITTSLLFALAGLWHTWLNWRALISYFQDKLSRSLALKRELVVALLLTLFFTVGAVYKTPPLNYLLEFNDSIKEYWIKSPDDEPPIAHAELLPLNTFLQKEDIELERALSIFKEHGIVISGPEQKLGEIAARNRTSPAAIFKLLNQTESPDPPQPKPEQTPKPAPGPSGQQKTSTLWTAEMIQARFEGKGVGRKTIAELCTEFQLDQNLVINKLASKKISAKPDDSLKELGSRHNELPLEIMKIILAGHPVKE